MRLHIGHTFFGAGNLGDDLVLGGFLQGLHDAGADDTVAITCATTFDVAAQRRRFPRIAWSVHDAATRDRLIAGCDAWIGLGGPLLQELDDSWLLREQLAQLTACRRLGKPVYFLGCGVDRRSDAQRPDIRSLLDLTRWIWTRDAASTRALTGMGFDRVTTGADLSHLVMSRLRPASIAPGTGFVCNFERPTDYSIQGLARLVLTSSRVAGPARWLVQEIRRLPGSELDLFARFPDDVRNALDLRKPDYDAASLTDLLAAWGSQERLFSTRYHGAIIGAWSGSRVAVFERHQKIRGLAETFELASFPRMPDPGELGQAFATARPVAQAALDGAVDRARQACYAMLEAVSSARATPPATPHRIIEMTMTHSPIRVERLALEGTTSVHPADVGRGLKCGEIYVVRGCLQAIGALAPLRAMVLDTLEEIAGPLARQRVETEGMVRLHEIVSIEDLMKMNPLMKERARPLAPQVVAGLAALLPDLGSDIHFEDTPNVRIFVPEDVSAKYRQALDSYAERRGGGGELTLHPPHQDSRHFHPVGAINIWCAIDQVSEDNSMSVFPEFYGHHLPFDEVDGGIRSDQFLGPMVATALEPGDAWLFETSQLHGSTLNQTNQTRVVISFRVTADTPQYRDKPWYNYVRPADCSASGIPPNTVDYSGCQPNRGRTTLDTSGYFPSPVPSSRSDAGDLHIASTSIIEGSVKPISDRLCATRIDGRAVVFARRCPHAGSDLAGGTVRNGKIVCPWHGLRMDPATGASACESIPHLGIAPSREEDGVIVVAPLETDGFAPIAATKPYAGAIDHFHRMADRFHAVMDSLAGADGQWGLEELAGARSAAAYALLAVPGDVVRDRLEAAATTLVLAVLQCGVRRTPRTLEEDTAFIECWRRIGAHVAGDDMFNHGLAAMMLSTHAFEILALDPLSRSLGWAEPLWLQCLLEILPANVRGTDLAPGEPPLPAAMQNVQRRISAMEPDARAQLLRAFTTSAGPATTHMRTTAGQSSLQQQVEILREYLAEANADRDISHQNIHTLAAHLQKANADLDAVRNSRMFRLRRLLGETARRAGLRS